MDAPIEPTVTRDDIIAALDARIAAVVVHGEDLVSRCGDGEIRTSMPAVAPMHVATAISPGCHTGKRFEALLEKWNEAARLDGIDLLVESIARHILHFGATTYHVKEVMLTTGHRQDRDWVDFSIRVVVPACAAECGHLRE